MSEPRLVAPLLAEHIMGDPISDHHGVRCCPALHNETEDKYIVKIVSVPASERQLEALLLSGAYATAEEARRYFQTLAEETVEEAKILQKLTKLEGFCGCEGWQLEQDPEGCGFDVYLLSRYGMTLERWMRRGPMTHLAAVNLGLDLCAALSVSRRNGWLYVDLKPENIFVSDTKGYLIGDLGFVSLRSLKYASLPEKYRSAYTAPEIRDAYSSLNGTLDIYAAGMILRQVFHGGTLPEDPETAPEYADPDMAAILAKACAPDPEERWQDPEEMGQALVAYLQSHSVNEDPIVPLPEPKVEESAEEMDEIPGNVDEPNAVSPIIEAEMENAPEEEPAAETSEDSEAPATEEETTPDGELPVIPVEGSAEEPASEGEPEQTPEEAPAQEPEAVAEPEPEQELEQFVIEGFLLDETLQDPEAVSQLSDSVISSEVSQMLAQADELLAHKTPDPVVAPEPIEVPVPELILPEPESQPDAEPEPEPEPEAVAIPRKPDPETKRTSRRRLNAVVGALVLILVLMLAVVGGKYYYDDYYLQNIAAISLDGAENWLKVTLVTDIDSSLLTVTCTDTYGSRLTQSVVDGQAVFTDLASGTAYRIQVTISGRHQLTGVTTANYSTAAQTAIVGLSAIAGSTDGSVILNFSVQGPDSDSGWLVKYSTAGGETQSALCNGHGAMISGLTVGEEYTFRLVPLEDLYLVGEDSIVFTPVNVVLAQDLTIRGFENNALVADWSVPAGAQVASWTVRCYNTDGYDQTFTVTEPRIEIPELDISLGYTLEVKAEGMLEGKQTSISAGSVTFKEMLIDNSDPDCLVISWPYEGTAPEGGWTLRYSVDGSEAVTVNCEKNTCTLEELVPGGCYSFEVVLPEEITHFGGTAQYQLAQIPAFAGYGFTAADVEAGLYRYPEEEVWTTEDLTEAATVFYPGERILIALRLPEGTDIDDGPYADRISITFLLRSSDGTYLDMTGSEETWSLLWEEGSCLLELPWQLDTLGGYNLEILFDGSYITETPITFTVEEVPPAEETDPEGTEDPDAE